MGDNEAILDVERVKNGWAAYGDGWAVHGSTREEAIRRYHEAVERHKRINARAGQREHEWSQADTSL